MSMQGSKQSRKSMGFASDSDIEQWSSDAKLKARLYQKRMNKSTTHRRMSEIANEQDAKMAVNTSLNRLREKTREQRSNSSSLSNHMNYLEVDLSRKKQMVDIAKSKYKRMIEVRNKSVLEKKELNKERQDQMKKHYMSVSLKASRIKFERRNSSINSNLWKSKNQEEAVKVKDTRVMNERFIAQRKDSEAKNKRELVENGHKMSDISRERLRELKQKKVEEGKKHHNLKLLQQFAKSEMQRRKNAKLLMIFKQKTRKIEEERMENSKELSEYEYFLGKCFNMRKTRSKDSFYMTN